MKSKKNPEKSLKTVIKIFRTCEKKDLTQKKES